MYLITIVAIAALASSQAPGPTLDKHIIPLYGNSSLGYYYANLYIGSPPQQQSVIVDTGSGILALPCSKCTSCGYKHLNIPFKIQDSKSTKFVTCNSKDSVCEGSCWRKKGEDACTFQISYAEGSSLNGIYIEDDIQFQKDSKGESIRTSFGCTTRETNLFFTQAANGIFGLAPERKAKLLEKMYQQHSRVTGQQFLFSLCLAKNGGQLVVGRIKRQLHSSSKSVVTPYDAGNNLYNLKEVGQIRSGSDVIKKEREYAGSYGVFIDSGSTFSYFPTANFRYLTRSLENACSRYSSANECLISKNSNVCFKIEKGSKTLEQKIVEIFPSIDIVISGQVVGWSPTKYFVLQGVRSAEVCLGIYSLDRYILGANWMADRDIVFNNLKQTVEIFSDASCAQGSDGKVSDRIAVYNIQKKNEVFNKAMYKSIQRSQFNEIGMVVVVVAVIIVVFMVLLIAIGKCCPQKKVTRIQDEETQRMRKPQGRQKKNRGKSTKMKQIKKEEISKIVIDQEEDDVQM